MTKEAARDLHGAKLLLKSDDSEPSRSLFLSQQAAEKAAKAFLTLPACRSRGRTIWWNSGCSAAISIRVLLLFSRPPPI